MTQVSKNQLNRKVFEKIFALLPQIISNLRKEAEAKEFVNAIFSKTEQIMIAKRFAIMFMLRKDYSYEEISFTLKVSYGTIAKMSQLYQYASDNFKKQIDKLIANETVNEFLNEVAYRVQTFIPPKGRNWSRWRKEIEKERLKVKNPF